MRKQTFLKFFFGLSLFTILGLFALVSPQASATGPTAVNFQGKVVNADGTNVTNGTYSFIFRLYDTSSPTTSGTCASN
jgi:hypothetical protein